MKRRIVRLLIAATTAGLVVAMLLSLLLANWVYRRSLENRLNDSLVYLAALVDLVGADDATSIASTLRAADSVVRVGILDSDGRILADSTDAGRVGDLRADRPEVRAALVGERGFDARRSATSDEFYLYAAVPHGDLILRAALPAGEIRALSWALVVGFALCLIAGLIAATLLGRRYADQLITPILIFASSAEDIADGDLASRVDEYPDELGQMSRAFNQMADRIQDMHGELVEQNVRLETIIRGLDDGIIALRADGVVVLLSPRAVELLGPFDSRYQRLENFGQNYAHLARLGGNAPEDADTGVFDMHISYPRERQLTVAAQPVRLDGDPQGTLLVIRDVTRMRQLEQLRQDFVANVSHELKTPLTSIRGYIDLLRSSPRDETTRQQFYEIIDIESERLLTLISDMLQLSEIENRGRQLPGYDSCCDAWMVVHEVLSQLEPIAAERKVRLHSDVPEDIEIPAAAGRVRQLLTNLLSNALFYNRPGGDVWLTISAIRDRVVIEVRDNGIGIPLEHQERIFERFYRVHKERSRSLGGTGLGLSIVKHIVSLYDGQITLNSEPGCGTTFTIQLPLVRENNQSTS
ncbi:MAG: ATP-binding protein [Bacillota bacterium]|nr:ATP-binding protein [Bacillota bacterium]